MSQSSKELQFAPDLIRRLITEILREYPRKTFGYFLAEQGTDPRTISHFYVFSDDARSSRQVSDFFVRNGAHYENNPTADFLATAQETVDFERWRRRAGLTAVGVFHTHLRHPAHLAKIDQRLHPRADLFHLLISLRNPAQPELAAWRLTATGFVPCRIVESGIPHGGEDGHYFPPLPPSSPADSTALPVEIDTAPVGAIRVSTTLITNGKFARVFPRHRYDPKLVDHPATNVSYRDAESFCIRTHTRLLTEDEWMLACDGIATTEVTSHADDRLSERAYYSENSGNHSAPVAKRIPNRFGLFDMQGNVWEWCSADTADSVLAPTKGGGYLAFAETCDPTHTQSLPRGYMAPDLGFRVCFDAHE